MTSSFPADLEARFFTRIQNLRVLPPASIFSKVIFSLLRIPAILSFSSSRVFSTKRAGKSSTPNSRRKSFFFIDFKIEQGRFTGQGSHAPDIIGPLSYGEGAPGIQQIESMGAFQEIVISRHDQFFFQHPAGFGFEKLKIFLLGF